MRIMEDEEIIDIVERVEKENQEIKADAGKHKLSLVPSQIIKDIAEIREYGNRKYKDPDSWKRVEKVRYVNAMYRHMIDYIDDNKGVDEESGISRLKHLACNVAFLCEMEMWDENLVKPKSRDKLDKAKEVLRFLNMSEITPKEHEAISDILEYLAEE